MGESATELGPIIERVALACLNLSVLSDQCAGSADVLDHRGALSLEAKAGFALTIGADSEIGDKFFHCRCCNIYFIVRSSNCYKPDTPLGASESAAKSQKGRAPKKRSSENRPASCH